jgi:hypothetical protein
MKNCAAAETVREDFIQLQHIGKIDRPPEVVIFLHICKIAIFVFLSIYMKSSDIWFSIYGTVKIASNRNPNMLYSHQFDTNRYLGYFNCTILRYFKIVQTTYPLSGGLNYGMPEVPV